METILLGLVSESVKHLLIKGPCYVIDKINLYRSLETLSVHIEPACGSLALEGMLSLKYLDIHLGPFCVNDLRLPPSLEVLRISGRCSCSWLMDVVAACSLSLRHLSLIRSAFSRRDYALKFHCPVLESLELTKCTGLVELSVCAPCCRVVRLEDDIDLKSLTIDSNGIEELDITSLVSLSSLSLRKPYPHDIEIAYTMWPDLELRPIVGAKH